MISDKQTNKGRRVVLIHWKQNRNHPFQVFSNLKNFCASFPRYNYNTLNNYLSKEKKAYENDQIRIERKNIITAVVKNRVEQPPLRLSPVVKKGMLRNIDQDKEDLQYWLSMPVHSRASAVTYIVSQSLEPGQRMDKTILRKRNLLKG